MPKISWLKGYHRLLEAIQQWCRGGRRHRVCSRSSSPGHRLVAITDHVANRLPALDAWAAGDRAAPGFDQADVDLGLEIARALPNRP